MINPTDQDTLKAMVEYRMQQLRTDAIRPADEPDLVVFRPSRSNGLVWSFRQAIGLAVVRAGARFAGICVQTRFGAQQ